MDNQIKLLSDLLGQSEFSIVDHYLNLLAKNNSVEQTLRNLQEKLFNAEKQFNEEKQQYLKEIELLKQRVIDNGKKQNNENKKQIVSDKYDDLTNKGLDHGLAKGVWVDPETKLMWSRICIGQEWKKEQCYGYGGQFMIQDAINMCENFRLANFDDWRLPSKKELMSLLDNTGKLRQIYKNNLFNPRLDNYNGEFWSSTLIAKNKYVYINFSILSNKKVCEGYYKNFHYVRAVRGAVRS